MLNEAEARRIQSGIDTSREEVRELAATVRSQADAIASLGKQLQQLQNDLVILRTAAGRGPTA